MHLVILFRPLTLRASNNFLVLYVFWIIIRLRLWDLWESRVEITPDIIPKWGRYFHKISGFLIDHNNMCRLLCASFREGVKFDVNSTPAGDYSIVFTPAKMKQDVCRSLTAKAKSDDARKAPIVLSNDDPNKKFSGFSV